MTLQVALGLGGLFLTVMTALLGLIYGEIKMLRGAVGKLRNTAAAYAVHIETHEKRIDKLESHLDVA